MNKMRLLACIATVFVLFVSTAVFAQSVTKVVNINKADETELATLPGIGEKLALRVVEYRKENGPFKRIEELLNVQGIGTKNFEKLRALITVGSERPADASGDGEGGSGR